MLWRAVTVEFMVVDIYHDQLVLRKRRSIKVNYGTSVVDEWGVDFDQPPPPLVKVMQMQTDTNGSS